MNESETTRGPEKPDWPLDDHRLLPLLPMIYVAWSDGDLTTAEMEAIRDRCRQLGWLDERGRGVVDGWLDPGAPPTPAQLRRILASIRELADPVPEPDRLSLAQLGLELARSGDDPSDWAGPDVARALEALEEALGVAPVEATRALFQEVGGRPTPAAPGAAVEFDVGVMSELLDGSYRETRERVRTTLREPMFRHVPEIDRDTHRARVLEQCRELARRGFGAAAFPPEYGGDGDLGKAIAVFETLAFGDLSLVVKVGVQFGLFGGSVYFLGTRRHHDRYLGDIGRMALHGCFAMTEAGHGSNVRDIETVARYEPDADVFVVHTPSESARKEWIGNGLQGQMATVFAQLEVGGVRQGVHALLVPLRDQDGELRPGIRVEDRGYKLGLNGVDNAIIWFDRVRVPRENLLDRFAKVDENGAYWSPIPDPTRRFFTMLSTLVIGRISVAAASLSAAKSGLTIAVRYGAGRRQFGPAGAAEIPILDYRTHQRRLMPPLAAAYALDFALENLVRSYLGRTDESAREVEVTAAALKAWSSWHTVRTLQTCREACGGQGYLAANRFAALKADTDVFTTFEGDNTVLMQLVAKGLLTDYKQQFQEMQFLGIVQHVAGRAAQAIAELNPIVTRLTDESHLRDPEFQRAAFRYREDHLRVTAARRLKKRLDEGLDSFVAFNQCQDHAVALAHAYAERVILEGFATAVDACEDASIGRVLATLRDLFALSRIEEDRGWFLESGYIEAVKAKAIRKLVNRLCAEVRDQAVPLVDAFAIPDECLGAPIAIGAQRTPG